MNYYECTILLRKVPVHSNGIGFSGINPLPVITHRFKAQFGTTYEQSAIRYRYRVPNYGYDQETFTQCRTVKYQYVP
jgi:hypothetical protein